MAVKNILITGGTGFIGKHLEKVCLEKNHDVAVLSRRPTNQEGNFHWDIDTKSVDLQAFQKTDTIIHLAGAGIADGRWTGKRKREIIDSRVKSAELIFEKLKANPNSIRTFISASAIGIYGDCKDEWIDETHPSAKDFLGETCRQWEAAANQFSSLGIRVVIIRIGIILAKDGGALPQMAQPIRWSGGTSIGSGKQFMSWIHVHDLCAVFLKAIEDESLHGVYNAVAPVPVTNREFMKSLSKTVHRPFLPVNVPAFILKLILGEKAQIVLDGQRVSSKKIQQAGFKFQFENVEDALQNLLGKK